MAIGGFMLERYVGYSDFCARESDLRKQNRKFIGLYYGFSNYREDLEQIFELRKRC